MLSKAHAVGNLHSFGIFPSPQKYLFLLALAPLRLGCIVVIVVSYAILSRFILGDVASKQAGRVCGLRQWLHRQCGKISTRALLFAAGFVFVEERGMRDVSVSLDLMARGKFHVSCACSPAQRQSSRITLDISIYSFSWLPHFHHSSRRYGTRFALRWAFLHLTASHTERGKRRTLHRLYRTEHEVCFC